MPCIFAKAGNRQEAAGLSMRQQEIARQIEEIYWSRHTMFVQKNIVIKDEKIRKIYKRNREK